jgi:hypothetical protein
MPTLGSEKAGPQRPRTSALSTVKVNGWACATASSAVVAEASAWAKTKVVSWSALCRRRHNYDYAELRIMPTPA